MESSDPNSSDDDDDERDRVGCWGWGGGWMGFMLYLIVTDMCI